MENQNLPGLTPLWLLFFALALGVGLATCLPLVVIAKEIVPADWLGFAGSIIGAGCTIAAGGWAYYGVRQQIKITQGEIEGARQQAREAKYTAVDSSFKKLAEDIDRLVLAKGFLSKFVDPFPASGNLDGFTLRLFHSRNDALDFISHTAVTAPFGYGEIISTVMTRMQRIGDRIDQRSNGYLPAQGILSYYDPIVREAIIGIRSIVDQLEQVTPVKQGELVRLAEERDSFK